MASHTTYMLSDGLQSLFVGLLHAFTGTDTGQPAFVPDARNIASLVAALLIAALASSAGVGGGAFFVPLFMVCVGFSLKAATGLSQAVIAAVSLASIAFNLPRHHPEDAALPLINYPLCLAMTPALLFGVVIGVLVNAAAPTWLITTMLVVLLTYMCRRTTRNGLTQWDKESQLLHQQQEQHVSAQQADVVAEAGAAGLASFSSTGAVEPAAQVVIAEAAADSKVVRDSYRFPWLSLLGVAAVWLGFGALQVLKDQQQRCSKPYFEVFGGQLLFSAVCSAAAICCCFSRQSGPSPQASSLADPLLGPASISSSQLPSSSTRYQNLSSQRLMWTLVMVAAAGAVAGVVGVGGGMFMGPILLDMGVHPQSATATSNILVFMCSSAAALAFLLSGRLVTSYAVVYCSSCAVASLVGLTLVGRLVRALGRPSLVVLLLAFIMGAGGLVSGVFGFLEAWHQHQQGTDGFKSIC